MFVKSYHGLIKDKTLWNNLKCFTEMGRVNELLIDFTYFLGKDYEVKSLYTRDKHGVLQDVSKIHGFSQFIMYF